MRGQDAGRVGGEMRRHRIGAGCGARCGGGRSVFQIGEKSWDGLQVGTECVVGV